MRVGADGEEVVAVGVVVGEGVEEVEVSPAAAVVVVVVVVSHGVVAEVEALAVEEEVIRDLLEAGDFRAEGEEAGISHVHLAVAVAVVTRDLLVVALHVHRSFHQAAEVEADEFPRSDPLVEAIVPRLAAAPRACLPWEVMASPNSRPVIVQAREPVQAARHSFPVDPAIVPGRAQVGVRRNCLLALAPEIGPAILQEIVPAEHNPDSVRAGVMSAISLGLREVRLLVAPSAVH